LRQVVYLPITAKLCSVHSYKVHTLAVQIHKMYKIRKTNIVNNLQYI